MEEKLVAYRSRALDALQKVWPFYSESDREKSHFKLNMPAVLVRSERLLPRMNRPPRSTVPKMAKWIYGEGGKLSGAEPMDIINAESLSKIFPQLLERWSSSVDFVPIGPVPPRRREIFEQRQRLEREAKRTLEKINRGYVAHSEHELAREARMPVVDRKEQRCGAIGDAYLSYPAFVPQMPTREGQSLLNAKLKELSLIGYTFPGESSEQQMITQLLDEMYPVFPSTVISRFDKIYSPASLARRREELENYIPEIREDLANLYDQLGRAKTKDKRAKLEASIKKLERRENVTGNLLRRVSELLRDPSKVAAKRKELVDLRSLVAERTQGTEELKTNLHEALAHMCFEDSYLVVGQEKEGKESDNLSFCCVRFPDIFVPDNIKLNVALNTVTTGPLLSNSKIEMTLNSVEFKEINQLHDEWEESSVSGQLSDSLLERMQQGALRWKNYLTRLQTPLVPAPNEIKIVSQRDISYQKLLQNPFLFNEQRVPSKWIQWLFQCVPVHESLFYLTNPELKQQTSRFASPPWEDPELKTDWPFLRKYNKSILNWQLIGEDALKSRIISGDQTEITPSTVAGCITALNVILDVMTITQGRRSLRFPQDVVNALFINGYTHVPTDEEMTSYSAVFPGLFHDILNLSQADYSKGNDYTWLNLVVIACFPQEIERVMKRVKSSSDADKYMAVTNAIRSFYGVTPSLEEEKVSSVSEQTALVQEMKRRVWQVEYNITIVQEFFRALGQLTSAQVMQGEFDLSSYLASIITEMDEIAGKTKVEEEGEEEEEEGEEAIEGEEEPELFKPVIPERRKKTRKAPAEEEGEVTHQPKSRRKK